MKASDQLPLVITAGMDIQAEGVEVRLSFSLLPPSCGTPSSEAPQAGFEAGNTESTPQSLLARVASESVPQLLEAFARAHAAVLATRCLLLQQQVQELRTRQSSEGGAA